MSLPAGRTGQRKSKLQSLAVAIDHVRPDSLVALGGLWFHNNPSAAVRELARRDLSGLRIVAAPPSSYAVDLLLGAGCVTQATIGHVSFEHMGLAPNLRRAAQEGSVEIVDADEATILGGIMATLEHLPEHPVSSVKGTDIALSSAAPVGTLDMVAPRPIRPDFCIIHAQEGDIYGNLRCHGTPFCDPVFAKASQFVVATVDRIIDNDEVRRTPHRTTIPGYHVDIVVEAPYGAHPCSSQGLYTHDEEAIRSYVRAGSTSDTWQSEYLEPFVRAPANLAAYVDLFGGSARIEQLAETVR